MHEINHLFEGFQCGQALTGNLRISNHQGFVGGERCQLGEHGALLDCVERLLAVIEYIVGISDFEGVFIDVVLVDIDRHIHRAGVANQHIHISAAGHQAQTASAGIEIAGGVEYGAVSGGGFNLELFHVLNELLIGLLALSLAGLGAAENLADGEIVGFER